MSREPASMGLDDLAGRISYSQCWEDPGLLSEALQVGPDDDVLSICSAGDNSFALAIDGAKSITAIDLSLPQLHLAELKLLAAREMPVESMRCLLGLDEPGRRVWFYHSIREGLSAPARAHWDAHEATIRKGISSSGRFERYFALFRTRLIPLVHRRSTVAALLATGPEDQAGFYDAHWNNWRWRGLFRLFFSEWFMARAGRSPAHFRYVDGPVAEAFLGRAGKALRDLPLDDNFFVQWMLTGSFRDLDRAHPFLGRAGHAKLGAAAERIRFVHQDLEGFLASCAPGSFSAFNYSNVFEYLSPAQHRRILELTLRVARPGARIAYWNLLVPRWRPDDMADVLTRHTDRASELFAKDRAFVYGGFQLESVRGSDG
jgi:S-adenosylmethionine-diacylglycerol 3-amino-3-carboxypropyl transferase